jgi:hypothetical protein
MKVNQAISCLDFPCQDVNHDCYYLPVVAIEAENVRMVVIAEAAPKQVQDGFYESGSPLFAETTLLAFGDAGLQVSSIDELLAMGVYLTTAVKCGKTEYNIKTSTIKTCSQILGDELAQFPNLAVIMLMGDVAIKSLNYIARRNDHPRVIPAGPTYKIRGEKYLYNDIRVFPSYLQAGPAFFIEKSKRRMIAEDLSSAIRIIE